MNTIKFFVCDVDGTLTDGMTTFDQHGNISKRFSVIDGMGFNLLRKNNIEICWITSSTERCILYRANHCKINHYYSGIEDKFKYLEYLLEDLKLSWDEVAYIGDDINDLECLEKAKISAIPNNSFLKLDFNHYKCSRNGGDGAVREFIEYLLN